MIKPARELVRNAVKENTGKYMPEPIPAKKGSSSIANGISPL